MSELERLEERIGQISFKMSEKQQIVQQARDAEEELEQLRHQLVQATAEYQRAMDQYRRNMKAVSKAVR